jgi:hypothetical protein
MPESSRRFERSVSRTSIFSLIAILCCLIVGCGGGSTHPSLNPAMNGNFSISATSSGTSGLNTFGGAIQTDSTGHVTGTMHVQGSFLFCFGVPFDLPLTGTLDATGHLNATIAGSSNQTIALNATVSPDGALLSNGSYSGSGTGCAGGDQGTITGFQVQAFTGTYSATFSPSASTSIGLVLPLTQSAAPDSHGMFPVNASTVTVTGGAACGFASATLVTAGSFASGDDLNLILLGSDGLSIMFVAGATTDGTTKLVPGDALIDTGPCGGQAALLTLSRP